jgi:hypothetical protein
MVLLLFLTPDRHVGKDQARVHVLLQVSLSRQVAQSPELLICAQVSTRVLRTALPGLGDDGQEIHLLPFTRAILLTTRSRSVFWRSHTTKPSRSRYKRELLSHITITISALARAAHDNWPVSTILTKRVGEEARSVEHNYSRPEPVCRAELASFPRGLAQTKHRNDHPNLQLPHIAIRFVFRFFRLSMVVLLMLRHYSRTF